MHQRALLILFAVVLAFPMLNKQSEAQGQSSGSDVDRTIELIGTEYKFEPQNLEVQTGENVKIVFKNEGTIAHDFHIKQLGFKTEPIQPGNSTSYTFTAPDEPTDLTFACKVAGHEPAGMTGQIRVKNGDQSSSRTEPSDSNQKPSGDEANSSDQKERGKENISAGQQADRTNRDRLRERRNAELKDGWGAVSGRIVLNGEQPEPYKNEGTEIFEKQCDLEGSFEIQHVQVDGDTRGIRDALVYVKQVDSVHKDLLPPKTSTIIQDKCRFHPSVQVLRTGGEIKLVNRDPSVHNFKYDGLGAANFAQGNLTQRGASGKTVVDRIQVKTPGVYSSVCNVHPWMNGLFLAVDHHAYDVSGTDGQFSVQLPPGTHTLRIRHYTHEEAKTVEVTIPEGKTVSKDVKLQLKK